MKIIVKCSMYQPPREIKGRVTLMYQHERTWKDAFLIIIPIHTCIMPRQSNLNIVLQVLDQSDKFTLNSLLINKLGTWCLMGWQGT